MIHQHAEVANDAEMGPNARVGAFALVGVEGFGDPLRIGPDTVIRSHAVLYRGSIIGAAFHCGHHAMVRESCQLGDEVSIGTHSVVEHHVTMGDGVRLHSRCFVPELSVLEDGAWLGPGVIVTNARHPNRPDTKAHLEGVRVGRGAVIGAGAVLLPGISIGAGAIVGAGAVVVRDVAQDVTVVGNPATPKR